MTIGHDDPLQTMTLDEALAGARVPTLDESAEFMSRILGLASEAEREWFRERIVGVDPERMGIPGVVDVVRFYSGLAIDGTLLDRGNGIEAPGDATAPGADVRSLVARIEANDARLAAMERGPRAGALMAEQQRLMTTLAGLRQEFGHWQDRMRPMLQTAPSTIPRTW